MINIFLDFELVDNDLVYVELKKDNVYCIEGVINADGYYFDNGALANDIDFGKRKTARVEIKKQWRAFKSDYIKKHGLQNVDLPAAAAMFTIKEPDPY